MLLKSLLFKGIFLLFFTAFFSFSSFGQTPQAGLSSNPADANDILQLCEGTAVSFTGFQGGLFDAPKSYEFFIVRNGVVNRTPRTMVVNLSQNRMGPIAFGVSQQASKSEQFALNNIGVSASFSVENFDFGLQYNFPFRKQAQVYAPSLFELFVSFNFTAFRRNNRGFFKRLQIDNYF